MFDAARDLVFTNSADGNSITSGGYRISKMFGGMKRKQKGFVIPLIIAIVAIVSISGGYYFYNSKKIKVAYKNDDYLYLQNKKIVRDLAFSLFQLLSNYNYNDREIKILLIGKTIQSLHGSN